MVWNSRDNGFIGHVMTEQEMASLCDVYQSLDPDRKTKKTQYVLQTIWIDWSSKFDVLGPYFPTETGSDHKFLTMVVQVNYILRSEVQMNPPLSCTFFNLYCCGV